jgi:hypothetical protein
MVEKPKIACDGRKVKCQCITGRDYLITGRVLAMVVEWHF